MKYGIAYKNNDDNDFHGIPWIEGFFDDSELAESVMAENADKMKNPIIFFVPDIIEEEITWDYVNNHAVKK